MARYFFTQSKNKIYTSGGGGSGFDLEEENYMTFKTFFL